VSPERRRRTVSEVRRRLGPERVSERRACRVLGQSRGTQRHVRRRGADEAKLLEESPWENGYAESFNSRFRDELLDRELFLSLAEARVVLDQWRMDYNHRRPHSGLTWMTPAAFVAGLDDTASGVVPAAARAVSPVGATPLPPTYHADGSPTLSLALVQKLGWGHTGQPDSILGLVR